MVKPTNDLEPEPRSWNIWLTLMVIAVAFTIAVAVLEYIGAFRDLGIVLSFIGLVLAIALGISGSSQRTVDLIRFDLRGVRRDLARLGDDLGGHREAMSRGFGEMSREMGRGFGEMSREMSRGFGEMNRGLAEVAALLRERLPRP